MRNTDHVGCVGQAEFQELIGQDGADIREAEQRMISENSRQSKTARVIQTFETQSRESLDGEERNCKQAVECIQY